MALTQATFGVTNISDLSSTPNATEGLTAAQLQAKFDKTGADAKTFINETLISELDTLHGSITSEDLTKLHELTATSTELNYIDGAKSSIQTQLDEGWIKVTDTWTYASTNTIIVPSGAANLYRKGDRIRLKQGGDYKYYYIIIVADALLTVTGGSNYTVANTTITDIYYSHFSTPTNFPSSFNWTPTLSNLTTGSGSLITTFNINGSVLLYNILFTFGAGSAVGTNPNITLPVTPLSTTNVVLGILDSGTTVYYGKCEANTNGYMYFYVFNSSSTYLGETSITSSVPMTWADGDKFYASGTYMI